MALVFSKDPPSGRTIKAQLRVFLSLSITVDSKDFVHIYEAGKRLEAIKNKIDSATDKENSDMLKKMVKDIQINDIQGMSSE